jgi:hypothetical protein
VPLYELVGKAGNHLYTTSAAEKSTAIARGYTDKGINGYIAQSQQSGTSPLYRLLGKNGNHLYTVSGSEKSSATSQGYRDEGITGYIWTQGSETVAQQ